MSEQETEAGIFIEDEPWSNAEQQENEELQTIRQWVTVGAP